MKGYTFSRRNPAPVSEMGPAFSEALVRDLAYIANIPFTTIHLSDVLLTPVLKSKHLKRQFRMTPANFIAIKLRKARTHATYLNRIKIASTMKLCSKCGQLTPLDDFYRDARRPDGHKSACKACSR